MPERIPTIQDLQVKLCYICREEERAGTAQSGPPRAWTHPCRCTLIAHESCLLKWIHSSQQNPARAPNALKCPQCGATYELESDNPVVLKLFSTTKVLGQLCGKLFMVMGAAGVITIVGSSVYVVLTGYGAWAARQLLGKELFDCLLTDDPSNWTWPVLLNLPMLPITLIASRFRTDTSYIVPLIPILLASSPRPPLSILGDPNYTRKWIVGAPFVQKIWPPSPVLFGIFILPIVQTLYRRGYARLSRAILGPPPPVVAAAAPARPAANGAAGRDALIEIRVAAEPEDDNVAVPLGDVGPAGRRIDIHTTSLGQVIGGALLIPAISSFMGSVMLRLSRHSALLRAFLGIRPGMGSGRVLPPPPVFGGAGGYSTKGWAGLGILGPGFLERVGVTAKIIMGRMWNGSLAWTEIEPVWWRNALGFGLFVVAKDCLHLWYLWLRQRELKSRRVLNKDFRGVDIRELDLDPSFFQQAPSS